MVLTGGSSLVYGGYLDKNPAYSAPIVQGLVRGAHPSAEVRQGAKGGDVSRVIERNIISSRTLAGTLAARA